MSRVGLIAVGGIKKPSYFGYSQLHKLGTERLANPASDVLVTRRPDGSLVVARDVAGVVDDHVPLAAGERLEVAVAIAVQLLEVGEAAGVGLAAVEQGEHSFPIRTLPHSGWTFVIAIVVGREP